MEEQVDQEDLSWLNPEPSDQQPLMGSGVIQLQDPVVTQEDRRRQSFYDSQPFDSNWAKPPTDNNNNNNNRKDSSNSNNRGLFSFFNSSNSSRQQKVQVIERTIPEEQFEPEGDDDDNDNDNDNNKANPVLLPATHYSTLPTSSNPTGMTEKFPGEGDRLVQPDEQEAQPKPSKNPCLHCLHFFEFLVIIVLLGVLGAQIVPLFFMSPRQIGRVQTALRGYMTMFCLIFVLVEARAPFPFLQTSMLKSLLSRGLLYSFMGLVSLEEAVAVNARSAQLNSTGQPSALYLSWPAIFMQMTAYALVIVGALYMILGILCVGALKKKMEKDLEDKWAEYRRYEKERV